MSTHTLTPVHISPRREFAEILKQQTAYGHGDARDLGDRFNSWFDRLLLQSGLAISPPLMLAVCGCSAAALAGFAFVLQEDPLATALGTAIGFALPLIVIFALRARRQKQMTEQLPAAIDELSRAARTGRSLESCLKLVAADTPAPLGTELSLVARRMDLGLSVTEAIRELPLRTGLISASVLTTALSVHEQTGGDLVQVLDRLSRALRERAQFVSRLKAATAAYQGTAILMLILPLGIVMFFMARDADYVTRLLESRWGFRATAAAVVLQIIGSAIILRILSRSYRS